MRRPWVLELLVAALSFAVFCITLAGLLISVDKTYMHESFHWGYPNFQYFADSVLQGFFPFWDPFSHGGQPFYPVIVAMRLLDPTVLVPMIVAGVFTDNLVAIYNWNYAIQILVMNAGMYMLLRGLTQRLAIRLLLFPLLLFSGSTLATFRSSGTLDSLIWIPYTYIFLERIFFQNDRRWSNWLWLALFTGLNFHGYRFAVVSIFYLFFFASVALWHRKELKSILVPKNARKALVSVLVLAAMAAPNLVLFFEMKDYSFPVRAAATSTYESRRQGSIGVSISSYKNLVSSGTFATVADYLRLVYPRGSYVFDGGPVVNWDRWGHHSEANLYFGLLPWVIALFGLIFVEHRLKRLWVVILFGFAAVSLGPMGGLHKILYYVFPPVRFDRHPFCWVGIVSLALMFFFTIGLDRIVERWGRSRGAPLDRSGGQGHLFRLLRGVRRARAISFLLSVALFSVVGATALCGLTVVRGDEMLFHMVVLAGMVVSGFLLFEDLGRRGLMLAVLLMLALGFATTTSLTEWWPDLAIPIAGCLLVAFAILASPKRIVLPLLACAAFSLADVYLAFRGAKFVYESQPNPAIACGFNIQRTAPYLNPNRGISAPLCLSTLGYGMRYTSLVAKEPFALGAVKGYAHSTFVGALSSPRWGGFMHLKKYTELLDSDVPPYLVGKMLAAESKIVQFKSGGIVATDEDVAKTLTVAGWQGGETLLKGFAFVDPAFRRDLGVFAFEPKDPALVKLARSEKAKGFEFMLGTRDYNDYKMITRSAVPGLLYFANGFDGKWAAWVDGKPAPIVRANIDFMAVAIPSGRSEVRFFYEPKLFKAALAIFYLGFLTAAAGAAFTRRARS